MTKKTVAYDKKRATAEPAPNPIKPAATDPAPDPAPAPSANQGERTVAEPVLMAEPAPDTALAATDGRKRVIIEGVTPQVEGGRFPVKRTIGDVVVVEADVFTDGHDSLSCVLQYRKVGEADWREVPMRFLVNDRWQGEFQVLELGAYEYTVTAWVDPFKSWRHDLSRWVQAEDIAIALRVGEKLVESAFAGRRSLTP